MQGGGNRNRKRKRKALVNLARLGIIIDKL